MQSGRENAPSCMSSATPPAQKTGGTAQGRAPSVGSRSGRGQLFLKNYCWQLAMQAAKKEREKKIEEEKN